MTETITWIDASEQKPDVDTTVMVFVPEASEPIWPGWWSGEEWVWAEGATIDDTVTHWAELPMGPGAK